MKLSMLLENIHETLGDIDVTGVTCDSCEVRKGYAFVCIEGSLTDGHKFVHSAIASGASVIVSEKDTGVRNQIIVPNTHSAYASMCAAWFNNPAKCLKLIGITGTNGKTSVSYMLKTILEQNGIKVGLIGTIQNMIGDEVLPSKNTTPNAYELNSLFFLMKNAGCEYVVMEVSSHALDQNRIYDLEFEAGVFTNLTQDHLDYHLTMDNYLQAKRKLFTMCKKAILNYDDEYSERLVEGLDIERLTYSAKSNEATYSAKSIHYRADGVDFEFVGFGLISRIRLKTGGKFSVYNGLAAGVCATALGFPIDTISTALSSLSGVKGRAEVVPCDKGFTIIIDYAHTPDGLENILLTFKDVPKNRLVAVFGCGGDRDKTKRPLMGGIAAHIADFVIVTSDNPRTEQPDVIIKDILVGMKHISTPYIVIENRVEAIKYAIKNAQKDDIIVLAGKGHETYQILGTTTIHLDEREVVKEALEEL